MWKAWLLVLSDGKGTYISGCKKKSTPPHVLLLDQDATHQANTPPEVSTQRFARFLVNGDADEQSNYKDIEFDYRPPEGDLFLKKRE